MPPPPPPPALDKKPLSYKEQQKSALVVRKERWEDKYPIHAAAQRGNLLKLREFIEGTYVDKKVLLNKKDDDDWTPLMYACWYNHLPCARVLIFYGSDVSLTNTNKCTALHFAAGCGHVDIVRLLIESGADPNFANDERTTPVILVRRLKPDNWEKVESILLACRFFKPVSESGLFLPRYQLPLLCY
eukprot:Colp12_sorted_trinity150504_noHs@18817